MGCCVGHESHEAKAESSAHSSTLDASPQFFNPSAPSGHVARFRAYLANFSLSNYRARIPKVLKDDSSVARLHDAVVVQNGFPNEDFWARYFFNIEEVKPAAEPPTQVVQPDEQLSRDFMLLLRADDIGGDVIQSPESYEALASAVGLSGMDDPVLLVIAYHTQSEEGAPMTISHEGWMRGLSGLGVSSLSELKSHVPEFRRYLKLDSAEFRKVYYFIFDFIRESAEKRNVESEVAVGYWEMLLNEWPLLDDWLVYWREQIDSRKNVVTRDEWTQLLEFALDTNAIAKYDQVTSAWPTYIDQFIERMLPVYKDTTPSTNRG